MPNRSRARKVFLRVVGCTFLTYHMVAVTVTNLNTSTAVRDLPHRWFRPYTTFFGQWQEWDMFTTIPYYAAIRPSLVATAVDGTTTEFGPWMPNLEPVPDSLRITSLFARVMWSRNAFGDAIARWERTACRAIREQAKMAPKSVHLRLDTERLNPLQTVRTSQRIAHPEQFTTKPTTCRE